MSARAISPQHEATPNQVNDLQSKKATTEAKVAPKFDRQLAFSRTLGFMTEDELASMKHKTVAIAGLGGVGGSHLITLSRLGIGGFHIADFDIFELQNFNRQAGANMSSVGRSKIEVMSEQVSLINPELRITSFPKGVTKENLDLFLDGVDLYVDSLDFFAFEMRSAVFRACAEKGIPALTVGPVGMGAALVNFMPGKMTFHEYFQWKEGDSDEEMGVKFLVGLTPSLIHNKYLVAPKHINFKQKKAASTPMGCELAAGVAGAEALKILLKRGPVKSAPHSIQFDAYFNRVFATYTFAGNRNPLQKIKMALIRRKLAALKS